MTIEAVAERRSSDLIEQIEALLALDAKGALVPHGIGGLARELLTRSIAELSRRTPASGAGVVKALEWSPVNEVGLTRASTPFGMYRAKPAGDGRWKSDGQFETAYVWWLGLLLPDGGDEHLASSLDAAKAAAQVDYEARILSALKTTDQP